MRVSVVITTKNEEKHIKNCLDSIGGQTFPLQEIEIIVVDNNSTDKTKEIAQKYTEKVLNRGPERSVQRNVGMREKAIGEYVMYLDADMILAPGVIQECVSRMEGDKGLVALYVPEIIMGESFWSQVRRYERSFYDGTVIDAVRFMRRDIFVKVGGFDETMTGPEDWDLDKKIKKLGRVGLIGAKLFHNEADFNMRKYLSKKKYYAQSFAAYIEKWGAQDPDIRKQLGARYRFFGVFLENGKWKKLLQHPLLTCGMYFLRFLVGVNYLLKK